MRRLSIVLFAIVLCLSFSITRSARAFDAGFDQKLIQGMKWRLVGPFRGGRVLAVEGVPGEPNTYYMGGASGGVWKTMDGGHNWTPLFDHEAVASIGSIAVAPSNHNIIYVGTGEACPRGNITYGDGVYKSLDGGKTWKNIGLKDSQHIGAVIIDPRNPDIVFVAALGHIYGSNEERGVFRTTDGGRTWSKVLYKDEKTGASDIVFDPHNSNILYASLWEVYRTPYSLNSGGPGSGLYKSIDGGTTWKHLEGNGLPDGILGKIGVTVSAADSNRVYALIEAKDGGLYRSDDSGDSWTKVNEDGRIRQRAWYFSHIFADTKSPDTVYALNTGMLRSTDGGRTFNLLPAPHGDHHGLWIDPDNPQRLINGNDGGATISTDGGKTWTTQENQPTAQFYHVITDNRFPYYIYGAQQDNSTIAIASMDDDGVIGRQDWYAVGGGECGYIAPDPRDANIVYAGAEYILTRFDRRSNQAQDISVWPLDVSGHGAEDLTHRFQWTSPMFLSPHDPDVMYTAAERVFKSTDHGASWKAISDDLTRNDKSKQKPSGGPLTKDITSVEYYDTVFALAESPLKKGMIWAGTDDGLVQLTTNDGGNWTNVTPKQMPEWSMISIIEASPLDAGTAYIAVDRHKLDDNKPYIYKTNDSGKSWALKVNGIPAGAYVRAVREDPKRKGLLYAGTEIGVFFSLDDGENWHPLQLNLPTVPVHDLVIKNDDLVVATHGRSFWVLDDITPLRQIDANTANSASHLFTPAAAYRLHYPDQVDSRHPVGENPPAGAIIDYYFKEAPKSEVTIQIYDGKGKLVRKLSSVENKEDIQPPEWPDQVREVKTIPANAGLNRYVWNLRYDDPVKVPGAFYSGSGPRGPLVLPGKYELRMTVDGKTQSTTLEILSDPRAKVAAADLEKQFALSNQVYQSISTLHSAINQVRDLKAQIQLLDKRFEGDAKMQAMLKMADNLATKLSAVEEKLIQVNMKGSEANLAFPNMLNEEFDTFASSVESADAAPTEQQYQIYKMLSTKLETQLGILDQIISTDVTSFGDAAKKENIPILQVSKGKR
ncbi:MAG TPA: glycosyl hydrolase [Blastocatellia bacterium]|nr:glycosyl hydrolase [Blastocatellia bacterium]